MRFIGSAILCVMIAAALTSCTKETVAPAKAKGTDRAWLMDTPPDSTDLEGGQKNPVPPPPPPPPQN